MNTDTTTLPQRVRDALETYRRDRAAFESARDKAARLRGDLQKHTKAAEAADAEALSARNEAAALMRDTGASMKQIRDLKGKERAAYTLAEDYRAIIAEVQLALEEAELEAGLAKGAESDAYSSVATAYAEGLFEALGDALSPLHHAVHALAHAYQRQAGPGGAPWEQRGYRSAIDAALARAHSVIAHGVKAAAFDASCDPVLSRAERPNGLADFKVASPATKQKKLAEFARRAEALRTAVSNA
ncbi:MULTISPECIES: hypothetical protein [Cupriavidus]|uniref:Uncharacterized protein n=1 Tax=Cupriavidus numazuensis TaxID=221992 RepID=A0ABM8TT10_9BURK|nr:MULTISPECIES: hypothetical protein [Cupriavidus]MBP0633502.1 hypothetical protein [Cupriavidus sp. AcVe19-1a]CAG2159552.1 hypothetical protein LMG26411_06789 [Cupriavidus numazuensis]